jgi:hypothetical protein
VDDLKRICDTSEIPSRWSSTAARCATTAYLHVKVLLAVNHPASSRCGSPANGASVEQRLGDLREVKPWLANLHVFQWGAKGSGDRRELEEGRGEWAQYLKEAQDAADGQDRWALLEFVRGDSSEQLERDRQDLC